MRARSTLDWSQSNNISCIYLTHRVVCVRNTLHSNITVGQQGIGLSTNSFPAIGVDTNRQTDRQCNWDEL